ncbi:aldehyde dehydrogenase iron-sulfur subunit [Variovorax sp. WS11]|uniref:2Fe-2S iron-sulfur cluster-binding protein n=1 Tax=Variovorax sp. WS11 TaxID=1105204 RepID=UPI000D0DF2C3|nr:2Fe-2S iron-sulfur cluster-binding protein [Variovorax sp. WS11]NDZ17374.1 2Fe-2S iron-sulfur cluster binding domain-containing protein [Variovorax sp. WS11]PSL86089.1 aldehyde dehydrogenase iron-sulfur subunit [Variovorax sp. WS11]
MDTSPPGVTRRTVLITSVAAATTPPMPAAAADAPPSRTSRSSPAFTLRVNGTDHVLRLDPRVTLLDALREHLKLTGSKKGCDHGQCGACTVLVNGRRINSCLTLTAMHDGDEIRTIEGLGQPGALHATQAAFVKHDGYQCGYCTPGQICSAVGMLAELRAGMPSHVSEDLNAHPQLSEEELRERMSGNLCRCAGYPNMVAAIREVAGARA